MLLLIIASVLSGCSRFKGPLVTNRDLTPNEVKYYQKKGDDFQMIWIPILFMNVKSLSGANNNRTMVKMHSCLTLPVPFIGFGYRHLDGSEFDIWGHQAKEFHAISFAPLFSRTRISTYNSWGHKNAMSFTSILTFFGYGQVNGESIFKFIIPIGSDARDNIKKLEKNMYPLP